MGYAGFPPHACYIGFRSLWSWSLYISHAAPSFTWLRNSTSSPLRLFSRFLVCFPGRHLSRVSPRIIAFPAHSYCIIFTSLCMRIFVYLPCMPGSRTRSLILVSAAHVFAYPPPLHKTLDDASRTNLRTPPQLYTTLIYAGTRSPPPHSSRLARSLPIQTGFPTEVLPHSGCHARFYDTKTKRTFAHNKYCTARTYTPGDKVRCLHS